jgi:hypothetical protein
MPPSTPAQARAQRGIAVPGLGLGLAATLLAGCAGEAERTGEPPAADTPAPPAAPPTPAEVLQDPNIDHLQAVLADDRPAAWGARLAAARELRCSHPAGGAQLLLGRARHATSDLELAVAIECLAAGYPDEAERMLPILGGEFLQQHELEDAVRVAVSILRCHLNQAYPTAVAALVASGEHALFASRALLIGCHAPIVPVLLAARPGSVAVDVLLTLLADAAAGQVPDAEVIERVAQAGWPSAAVVVLGETGGAAAAPALRRCLGELGAQGRIEAALALANLGVADAAPDILLLHDGLAGDPRRAPLLLALGELRYEPALPRLLTACRDRTVTTDGDGEPAWPVAQAALIGLGYLPSRSTEAHDALLAGLARSDLPALAVAAARGLARFGERSDLESFQNAFRALARAGHAVQAEAVEDARDVLLGGLQQPRDQRAYLVVFSGADGDVALLTDHPLLALDEANRALSGHEGSQRVLEESLALSREDIARAIQLRNAGDLQKLRVGSVLITAVDLIAR